MCAKRSFRSSQSDQCSEPDEFDHPLINAAGRLAHDPGITKGFQEPGHGVTEGREVGRNWDGRRVSDDGYDTRELFG